VRVPPLDFDRSGDGVLHRSLNAVSTDSTMGVFPIFMNVVQFWLIDSIVKASGTAVITLPSDPADREPLFRSSTDSSDDSADDNANGDATATPTKRDIEAQGQVKLLRRSNDSSHTYPPSLNHSPTPTPSIHRASLSPPPASSSVVSARRQRPPPPPLQPRSPPAPAVNSPDPPSEDADAVARPKEDWQAWDGDEDWVEHVGEEGRKARRGGTRKREADGARRDDVS